MSNVVSRDVGAVKLSASLGDEIFNAAIKRRHDHFDTQIAKLLSIDAKVFKILRYERYFVSQGLNKLDFLDRCIGSGISVFTRCCVINESDTANDAAIFFEVGIDTIFAMAAEGLRPGFLEFGTIDFLKTFETAARVRSAC